MSELKNLNDTINELSSNSGRLEKERILAEHKDDALFIDVCKFLFDPMIVTGLSYNRLVSEASKGGYSFDLFDMGEDKSLKEVLDYLTKNNTGRDSDVEVAVNYITDNEDYSDLLCKLFSKELKMGIDAPTLNKVYGEGFIITFDVMLAENYFDNQDFVIGKEIMLSQKIDGGRLIAECGDSIILKTRQGQPYGSIPDIEKELSLFPKGYVYDGELVADEDIEDSEELFRITMKRSRVKGEKSGLVLKLFDMVPIEEFRRGVSTETAKQRKGRLESIFNSISEPLKSVVFLPSLYVGTDLQEIPKWLEKVVSGGGEGIMINLADGLYECKRTKQLLKVKKFRTADVLVTDCYEGTGRLVGRLGGISVVFEHEGKGYPCDVGSGFSDNERDYYWNHQEELLGKIVEIKYFEISQNQDGGYGMRFPTWIGRIREDKREISSY